MAKPKEGFSALFGEYVFQVTEKKKACLSTNVYIVGPDAQSKEVKIISRP